MKKVSLVAALLATVLVWTSISVYGSLYGWWLSPIAAENDINGFNIVIGEKLHHENNGNTAYVLIEEGQVVAEDYSASIDSINKDTLFPLASMSKLFTAYGVMQLVNDGKLDLDKPISNYLTRWKLPESGFDNSKVTARQLLSHTSGLSDGLGFGDYTPDEAIPTIEESLTEPRASKGDKIIQLGHEPGSVWEYSGGGYLIIQLLVEKISGLTFEQWIQKAVFSPLEMRRTTYQYLGDLDNTSHSYDSNGQPATLYRYASSAATGLSSTPADLTRFATAISNAIITNANTAATHNVEQMRQPLGRKYGADIWGLGVMLYAPTLDGDHVFGHDGANSPAINSTLRINPINGDAIIVLTTGSESLASSIAYEWTLWQTGYPDFLSFDKSIKSAIRPSVIGAILIIACIIILRLFIKYNRRFASG